MKKLDYYFDYWMVYTAEDAHEEGNLNLTKGYRFTSEDKAVEFAREQIKAGKTVSIKSIQTVDGW